MIIKHKNVCEDIVNFLNKTCDLETLSINTPWYYTYGKCYMDDKDVPIERSKHIEILVEETYDNVSCETEYKWFDLSFRQLNICLKFHDAECVLTNIMLREDDFNYVYKSDDDKSYKVFIDYIWYDDKYFYPDIGELKIFNYFKNVS